MQMDRMSAVGTLAAGVAHEINNPLAFVIANVEFAQREVARGPSGSGSRSETELTEVLRALGEARDGTERMRRIVRDLRTFSRGGDGNERPQGPPAVDVRSAVDWACAMAQNEIRHRARLVVAGEDFAHAACDEARLGQVLLNLIMNAAHAIPEGAAERNQIRVAARDDGQGHVDIEVRDTGSGIAPENLARIFDPFFTTKPVGVGTGLGLAIVQRIVTDHGGHVTVESEVGRGTTVRVMLPAARRPDTRMPVSPPGPAPAVTPLRPRVLVIDDEVQVLRAIQRNLGSTHEVIALTRAEEALERLQGGERFDAIVCDLMMPEMTGMDLHAALATAGSTAARSMVFITGGAFTPRAREFLASVDNPRLEKPFDFEVLRRTIRSA
jgi:CheY-like chemotaxis protein